MRASWGKGARGMGIQGGRSLTYWELIFVSFACIGDWSLLGLSGRTVPANLRPLAAAVGVCVIRPEIERDSHRSIIEQRIKAIGPIGAPRLRWCQKLKCYDRRIEWGDSLIVDGNKIK